VGVYLLKLDLVMNKVETLMRASVTQDQTNLMNLLGTSKPSIVITVNLRASLE
jgi:hypothetical protein